MTWTCRSCAPRIGDAATGQGLCPRHTAELLGVLASYRADNANHKARATHLEREVADTRYTLDSLRGRHSERRDRE